MTLVVSCEDIQKNQKQMSLVDLDDSNLFTFFETICTIPHGSGDTKAISDFLVEFAKRNGYEYNQDEFNNVIIWAPASPGFEDSDPIALQAHIDMVCVSVDEAKNPALVGVKPITDGTWIWADGTSLGADDGIGVAIILSILEDRTVAHPPIEAIFTVDEEVGLLGAQYMDLDLLQSRRMINLDNEAENSCVVSCAAGRRVESYIPVTFEDINGYSAFKIEVDGLLGGHSGVMINMGRANAGIVLAKLLLPMLRDIEIRISDCQGGIAENAIPSQAFITVAVPKADEEEFKKLLEESSKALQQEYSTTDPGMHFDIKQTEVSRAITVEDSKNIIELLSEMIDSIVLESDDADRSPLVSLNSGIYRMEDTNFFIGTHLRSNINNANELLFRTFEYSVIDHGGTCEEKGSSVGWESNPNSILKQQFLNSYKTVTGKEGLVVSIHGGLECGVFASHLPEMDIIAVGPTLEEVHSVNERVSVQSSLNTYKVVLDILRSSK